MLTRALLFALAVGLVASDSSKQLSFDTVPLSSEVPAHDVGRYTNCLVSCALRGAVAPFTGCSWITQAITKGSGCQISKPCFRKCFEPQAGVYTNRYSLKREGFVVDAKLTPSTVPSLQLQFQWPVDGAVYAQPLYAPGVKFADHTYRNLVIIATEFNSVYAFDADTREQLWTRALTVGRVVTANDIPAVPSRPGGPCTDIAPYYGITGTPVIDPDTDTVYVISYSVEGADVITTTQYRFNALDLATGAHKTGSPTAPLAATRTFPNGPLPNNATTFVAIKQLQRPGLALHKGLVYAAFGSHCDRPPYYPWLFAFDAKTLAISSFWTTPVLISRFNQTNPAFGPVQGGGPTIWMGGTGPTIFNDKLFVVTGRGPVDPGNGGIGNAILRFPLDLSAVEDFFIPSNGVFLDNNDLDLGSSGAIVVKDKYIMTGGKQGPLYLADAANLGGYSPTTNNANAFQVINAAPLNSTNPTGQSVYSGPSFWPGNGGQVFFRGRRSNQALYRYAWDSATGKLSTTFNAQAEKAVGLFSSRAANPVVQAASADATEAVVWEIDEQSSLLAWDAMSLKLLYSSNNTAVCGGTPSSAGGVVKFHLVTVAEGKVYMGCGDRVLVYGLPA